MTRSFDKNNSRYLKTIPSLERLKEYVAASLKDAGWVREKKHYINDASPYELGLVHVYPRTMDAFCSERAMPSTDKPRGPGISFLVPLKNKEMLNHMNYLNEIKDASSGEIRGHKPDKRAISIRIGDGSDHLELPIDIQNRAIYLNLGLIDGYQKMFPVESLSDATTVEEVIQSQRLAECINSVAFVEAEYQKILAKMPRIAMQRYGEHHNGGDMRLSGAISEMLSDSRHAIIKASLFGYNGESNTLEISDAPYLAVRKITPYIPYGMRRPEDEIPVFLMKTRAATLEGDVERAIKMLENASVPEHMANIPPVASGSEEHTRMHTNHQIGNAMTYFM